MTIRLVDSELSWCDDDVQLQISSSFLLLTALQPQKHRTRFVAKDRSRFLLFPERLILNKVDVIRSEDSFILKLQLND